MTINTSFNLNNCQPNKYRVRFEEKNPHLPGKVQATLGKKALGLKVTTLEGGQITFLQATGRHFGKIISELILLIGYFIMLWDEKKQSLMIRWPELLYLKNNNRSTNLYETKKPPQKFNPFSGGFLIL